MASDTPGTTAMTVKPLLLICGFVMAATPPTPPAGVPPVLMSDHHEAMCDVAVGDQFPSVDGMTLGHSATVVAVVQTNGWMSRQLVDDLPGDAAACGATRNVAAVLIDARDEKHSPDGAVQRIPVSAGDLAKFGTGRWPRVYLLDAQGRVVWFDIEWGISSRRDLRHALEATLASLASK